MLAQSLKDSNIYRPIEELAQVWDKDLPIWQTYYKSFLAPTK